MRKEALWHILNLKSLGVNVQEQLENPCPRIRVHQRTALAFTAQFAVNEKRFVFSFTLLVRAGYFCYF